MKCFNVVVLVLVLAGCKKEKLDPSLHFKANVSIEEKIQASKYNWNETKNITIHVTSPQDGMITIRALDGEIIYRGYLANEVLYEFVLKIPKEINQVLIALIIYVSSYFGYILSQTDYLFGIPKFIVIPCV